MRRSSASRAVAVLRQKAGDRRAEAVPAGQGDAAWPQEKLQGIARRSSIRRVALREAGREPMFSSAISGIGVGAKK